LSKVALADLPEVQAVLGQAATENFPVALRLLGPAERGHLMALYGYARLIDDIGDELAGTPADRLAALDLAEAELDRALEGASSHPIFSNLAATVASCGLEVGLLKDLIAANRQDQQVSSYETFEDLLQYCSLSANPVGRLVLGVFGETGEEKLACSDLVCSGLQVVEHLQDVAEDAARGRIYLPSTDLESFGVPANSLSSRAAGSRAPDNFRRLMAFEVTRARALLVSGARLVGLVGETKVAIALAGFAGGGLAQLASLERAGYDVLSQQVKAQKRLVATESLKLLRIYRGRKTSR
jgi:squalene synthase HpnC